MAAKKGTKKGKTTSDVSMAKKVAGKEATVVKANTGKTVSKGMTSKKTAAPARKTTAISERYSKTQIISELAANANMTRKQVNTVLDELAALIQRHVKKRSVGEFVLAGLIKIHTVKRPAKKAYVGINPFTGKETTFSAKPASVAVKVHALKGLKDMAQ